MELRQLKLFIAVAEEQNFTRAAEKCNLTQPSLTRQIQMLEDALGFALFDRSRRQIELTEAGKAFLEVARDTLARLGRGVRDARSLALPAEPPLQLGLVFPDYVLLHPLSDVLAAHGESDLQPNFRLPQQVVQELVGGCLDLGFLHTPYTEHPELEALTLVRERLGLGMRADHRLAARAEVTLTEWALHLTNMADGETWPELHAYWHARFAQHGLDFPASRHRFGPSFHAGITSIQASDEVVLLVETLAPFLHERGLTWRPLAGPEFMAFRVLWRRGAPARVQAFVKTARDVLTELEKTS